MHCFDNNYVVPAAVSFYSMLENASPEFNYKLYVLHTDITEENQNKLKDLVDSFTNASIEFINMENRFNDIWNVLDSKCHYSKEMFYKLLTPSIFPSYDKIIVTDVDVVFLGDISESYFSIDPNDDDIYFSGIKHVLPANSWLAQYYKSYDEKFGEGAVDKLKICAGYIVMDLKNMRRDNAEKMFVDYLADNSHRLLQPEQDTMNFCCTEKNIYYLPLNNLVCSYCYDVFNTKKSLKSDMNYSAKQIKCALNKPIQLHFATHKKPWNDSSITMADVWFLYLEKTGFAQELLQNAYNEISRSERIKKLPKRIYRIINKPKKG